MKPVLLLLLAISLFAKADSYSVVILGNDNTQFFAIDDSNTVIFATPQDCFFGTCYVTYSNGIQSGVFRAQPSITNDQGEPCASGIPANSIFSVCNGSRTAFVGLESQDQNFPALYVNNVRLYARAGAPLFMNAMGDIVFDDGSRDDWMEAIDLTSQSTQARFLVADPPTPVPEPPSVVLEAVGIVALILLGLRMRPRNKTCNLPTCCETLWRRSGEAWSISDGS